MALLAKTDDVQRQLEAFASFVQVWYAQLAPAEQQRVMVGEATRSQR